MRERSFPTSQKGLIRGPLRDLWLRMDVGHFLPHPAMLMFRYIDAFKEVAKTSTTMLLPSNASDPATMVAQAMAIFGKSGIGASSATAGGGGSGGGQSGAEAEDMGSTGATPGTVAASLMMAARAKRGRGDQGAVGGAAAAAGFSSMAGEGESAAPSDPVVFTLQRRQ